MNFQRKKRRPLDINLIPMIDVLLVLLIFFVLTTTFAKHTQLKINLPEADGADTEAQEKTITLLVNAKGEYALLDETNQPQPLPEQNISGLKTALQAFAHETKTAPLVISADGKTQHQAVISVLDVAQQLGFSKITFATNTSEDKP